MKSIPYSIIVFCFIGSVIYAGPGGLSEEFLDKTQSSYRMDPHTRAMYNAITNNNITDLALNRELLREHNDLFSHKIKTKGITNQKSSGRCWLFAALNTLRPKVIKEHKFKEFELSQNHLAFWDKLEKANAFLERIIEMRDRDCLDREMEILLRNPVPDGGWWEGAVALIEKYGVVPKDIMPETNSSESTSAMNQLLSQKLRSSASRLRKFHQQGKEVAVLRNEKEKVLKDVYRMLAMNLGMPPQKFEWRYEDANSIVTDVRTFTPKEFYSEFVGLELGEYVNVFSDPSKEYGRYYRMRMTSNMYDKGDVHFANVSVKILKKIAYTCVLDDEPIWFACDMGKDQNSKLGIMAANLYDYDSIYRMDMRLSKAEMALYRHGVPNHAMVFVGVDIQDDKPVKWLVENSWGSDKGAKGYWTLYDDWFDKHVYCVIAKRSDIPEKVQKIYDQEPIVLPPWDPMFAAFWN
ncbi:MAG: C1 family peptidase [Sedimentisphaerales bacterium]|nr:C1 family peptidase [Sedimentisphaerales bacterium]